MTKKEEKFCLGKGQLQNIVSAARNEAGACEKAKDFIKTVLEQPEKNKLKEKPEKIKKEKPEKVPYQLINTMISRKARKVLDYFF